MASLHIVTRGGELNKLIHKRDQKLLWVSIALGILEAMRSLKRSSYSHSEAAICVLIGLTSNVLWLVQAKHLRIGFASAQFIIMVGLVIIWIPISNDVFNALVSSELAVSIS